MKQKILYLSFLTLLISLAATKKLLYKQPKLQGKSVLILGDSVAFGYGTEGGIAKYLKKAFPSLDVINKGINGLTSPELLSMIKNGKFDEEIKSADIVILNIGGNDLLNYYKKDGPKGIVKNFAKTSIQYKKNIRSIYSLLLSLNPSLYIVQNSLYNSLEDKFQYFGLTDILYKIWNSNIGGKRVVKINTDALGKNKNVWIDMVHPNEEGYEILTSLIATCFDEDLKQERQTI